MCDPWCYVWVWKDRLYHSTEPGFNQTLDRTVGTTLSLSSNHQNKSFSPMLIRTAHVEGDLTVKAWSWEKDICTKVNYKPRQSVSSPRLRCCMVTSPMGPDCVSGEELWCERLLVVGDMTATVRQHCLPPLGSWDNVISRREVPMVSITEPGLSPRPWSQ